MLISIYGGNSSELDELPREIWLWCIDRHIHLSAAHIAGVRKFVADRLSKLEWTLGSGGTHLDYIELVATIASFSELSKLLSAFNTGLVSSAQTNVSSSIKENATWCRLSGKLWANKEFQDSQSTSSSIHGEFPPENNSTYITKWIQFCNKWKVNSTEPSTSRVIQFLTNLYKHGIINKLQWIKYCKSSY